MIFGSKLEAANAQITRLVAMLALVGYKPASADAANENDFKAALETHTKSAVDAASKLAVDAATAPLNATIGAYANGLKEAGVTFGAESAAPITAAAVTAAITASIETTGTKKAVAAVAASGHPTALPIATAPASAVHSNDEAPETKEAFHAKLNSLNAQPAARMTYFRKHKAKFGL